MMDYAEILLLSLSRKPQDEGYGADRSEWKLGSSLSLLERNYQDFGAMVAGKRVVDFGCGTGYQCVELVTKYDCTVVGIDSNRRTLEKATAQARAQGIPGSRLSFRDEVSAEMLGGFDVVVSQNSFEHFADPSRILDVMRSLVNESGKVLITFGPPWLAPFGSHMHFFCKVPWVNILFPEKTVMKVRSRYRNDGARRYEEVESGLNRMTIAKFERIVESSDLNIEFVRYRCVKGADPLAKVPYLREFFINHASVILSATAPAGREARSQRKRRGARRPRARRGARIA